MWRCGMKRLLAGAVISILLSTSVYGQKQEDLKLKSEKTAHILSYIPLNSPALFYVKRPVRGVLYTMLEVSGLIMISASMYEMVDGGSCGDRSVPDACEGPFGHMTDRQIGAIFAGAGFLLWFPPWLHTVIKTPDYLDDYNDKVQKKNAVSVAPIFTTKGKKQLYGLGLQYRF